MIDFFDDYHRRQIVIDNRACLLDILDTAGQEEYTALRSQWIRTGQGFLVIYDITSRSTFEQVEVFRKDILRVCSKLNVSVG